MSQRNQRDLELIYQRLTPKEGKWFTRLILKNYSPLCFDSFQIYRLCDPLLPSVLSIRGDFDSAISVLESTRSTLLPKSTQGGPYREQIIAKIKPQLGIKVGRQHWMKARSIKHCLSLGRGQMSVEDKIDGEYCQIHIDLSKGTSCIQVFSKSGKDRTEDCLSLHEYVPDDPTF
jgi:DNA ligase 4